MSDLVKYLLVIGVFLMLFAPDKLDDIVDDAGDFLKGKSKIESSSQVKQPPTPTHTIVGFEEAEVYFCPEDGCASALIHYIDSANTTIYIAIYSFTHDEIKEALYDAHERGVEIRVIMDRTQAGHSSSVDEELLDEGIGLRYHTPIMHNKFVIIDGKIVATGSFNWSKNGDTNNDENLIFFASNDLSLEYLAEFEELWGESV